MSISFYLRSTFSYCDTAPQGLPRFWVVFILIARLRIKWKAETRWKPVISLNILRKTHRPSVRDFFFTRRGWVASCVRSRRRFFFKSSKQVLLWQILNDMTHLAEIWVPEPQNNSKNNGTNFTWGHMGPIPVIRCFVHFFLLIYCYRGL